jgi:hypothetical protein
MTSTCRNYTTRLNTWLISVFSVISLCCTLGCDFIQYPAEERPYKNEHNLTGKMLYEIGDYYYKKATTTHFWGGAPELTWMNWSRPDLITAGH